MYYKIENKESEIYKTLRAFRQNEIDINKRNRKAVEDKIPYKWTRFLGYFGQQSFGRVTTYSGFQFEEPEKVDLKVWKQDKDNPKCFTPNKRTKAGREMYDFLNELESSSMFELNRIIGFEPNGRFTIPFLDICGDVLILYLDNKFEPKDESIIEITSKEFELLRSA